MYGSPSSVVFISSCNRSVQQLVTLKFCTEVLCNYFKACVRSLLLLPGRPRQKELLLKATRMQSLVLRLLQTPIFFSSMHARLGRKQNFDIFIFYHTINNWIFTLLEPLHMIDSSAMVMCKKIIKIRNCEKGKKTNH